MHDDPPRGADSAAPRHLDIVLAVLRLGRERRMTPVGLAMLLHCRDAGTATVSDLARVTGLTRSAASAALDRLVREGFVDRREEAADRRCRHVRLLDRGVRVLERWDHLVERGARERPVGGGGTVGGS